MPLFKKILAVLNPTSTDQLALDRAIHIARRSQGEVTALTLKSTASEAFIAQINSQLDALKREGIEVQLVLSDERDILRAILISQHNHNYDITIKEPHQASLIDSLFTPKDWKLLRTNASPVLMARSAAVDEQAPILAAVEAKPNDAEHQRLSAQILRTAHYIAEQLDAPLHIFSAYPAPMQDPSGKRSSDNNYVNTYRQACQALAAPFAIPDARIHLAEGPAELLLPEQAKALGAQLLLLGTVARKGLQGALLGNTAEQVLESLDTNVLVLAPESNE